MTCVVIRVITLLLLAVLTDSLSAQPQADTLRRETRDSVSADAIGAPNKNWITLHPLKAFFGLPYTAESIETISYHREVISHVVAGIGVSMVEWDIREGGSVSFDLRYYSYGAGISGPYFAAEASYRYIDDDKSKTHTLGGVIGWHWFPDKHFTANLGFGYDYYFRHAPPPSPLMWNENPILKEDMLAIQCEVGYAW